jgi:glycosyltransferase involved in cell wall biosynthesis
MLSEIRARRIDAFDAKEERTDLLVHALAQLPDDVTLAVSHDLRDRATVELLAGAYGIRDRVSFEPRSRKTRTNVPDFSTMAELIHELSDPSDSPAPCRAQDRILAGHRVALVTNLPAPYRIPLFGAMSRRLARAPAQLRVFFMGKRARGRPWIGAGLDLDFEHEWLSSFELPIGARHPLLPLNLERRLSAFRPTIVLAAGFSPFVSSRAARHARKHGVPFGIWSGEIAGRSQSRSRLRHVQRKALARRSDFAIAYGFLAGEYLRELSPGLPLVYGRNTSEAYAPESERSQGPEAVRLIAVADMAKREKGIDLLVDALERLPALSCSLTVVGPGARASGLESRARRDNRVRFVGALSQSEVTKQYAESDVFLFPSTAEADVFGLALVEAMGSGLAPVISIGPGAAADLGVHGSNCLLVRERTPAAWADALQKVVSDNDLRRHLAHNALRTIRGRWTINHACDGMIAGLRLGLLATGKEAA